MAKELDELENYLKRSRKKSPEELVKCVTYIGDLPGLCKENLELIARTIDVLVKYLNAEKTEERDAVHAAILSLLQLDTKASLIALLKNFDIPISAKVTRPQQIFWDGLPIKNTIEESRRHETDFTKRRITDLIEKSLEEVREDELQDLAKFFEEQANLEANEFAISNADSVGNLISCLQMAVPFFARGAPSSNFLNFINDQQLFPGFDKLPEQRRLDFLRALAEISSHPTAQVANEMLTPTVQLLEIYLGKSGENETMYFSYVECIMYLLHHLAYKEEDLDVAIQLCSSLSLTSVGSKTRARMVELDTKLPKDNEAVWVEVKNSEYISGRKCLLEGRLQATKNELRTCNNILAMSKKLQAKRPSFIGDDSVNPSWKESRIPIVAERIIEWCPAIRDRPIELKRLDKNSLADIAFGGYCELTKKDITSLVNLWPTPPTIGEGKIYLNDDGEVAALFWLIENSELETFVELVRWKGITGAVRNQMYHILCWAYAGSDLVSSMRCLHKLDKKNLPLCTSYLCAFVDREALKKKAEEAHRKHHCYGGTIENALSHIQTHGIPREIVKEYDCTDHHPPSVDEPWMILRRIKRFRRIATIEEAFKELLLHPIAADLIHYTGMHESGEEIYYGPRYGGTFHGHHGVLIEGVKLINGEFVAVCKMSNGRNTADEGYVYASLATMYLPVAAAAKGKRQDDVRGYSEPSHLLSNFMTVELYDTEDEEEVDEEEDAEKDEEEEDEGEEDEEEDETQEKEQDPPKSKKRRYG